MNKTEISPRERKDRQSTARTIALVGIFIVVLFYGLHQAQDVLLPVTLGILFAFLLGAPVRLLVRNKVPRSIAAFLVLFSALSIVGGIVYLLSNQAYDVLSELPDVLKQLDNRLQPLTDTIESMQEASQELNEVAGPIVGSSNIPTVQIEGETTQDNLLASMQGFLSISAFTIVLLYFILASGDIFIRKLVRVMPASYDSHEVYYTAVKIEHDIGLYLGSTVLINSGLGVAVGLMLWGLDMPNPLFWGLMAAVMNFIPYVGAIIMTTLVTIVALGMYGELSRVFLVSGLYLSLTAIEGFIITPMVHGRRLTLNAAMVFFALIVWGALWGIPGLLLAVPITATLKVIFDRIPAMKPIAVFLGR